MRLAVFILSLLMKMKIDNQVVDILLPMISEAGNVDIPLIMSDNRVRPAVTCRNILFRYLNEKLYWSTPRIGRAFHRKHATVIHGIKNARDYGTSPSYKTERAIQEDFLERIMIHENEN